MSRELQIHRIVRGFVCEIRFVHQQDDQFLAGNFVQRVIHVWIPFPDGIQTAQPDSRPSLLNREWSGCEEREGHANGESR